MSKTWSDEGTSIIFPETVPLTWGDEGCPFNGVPTDCVLIVPEGKKNLFMDNGGFEDNPYLRFYDVREEPMASVENTVASIAGAPRSKVVVENGTVTALEDCVTVSAWSVDGIMLMEVELNKGERISIPAGQVSVVLAGGETFKIMKK